MKQLLLVFALAAVLASHSARADAEHVPQLTQAQVIAIANDAARKSGIDLAEFHSPQADFENVRKDLTWFVFYQGILLYPDNFFSVIVDDRTRETSLHRGL